MAEPLVREWLTDCKTLSPSETHTFSSTTLQNNELIQGIFTVLEERARNQELVESVCNQLFTFYRSRDVEMQKFTLQFLPPMIGTYLCALAQGDKKSVRCIEVVLLGIYNLEVVDSKGKTKTYSFRMPSVAQPSIYHAPISLASAALTENALSKLEKGDSQIIAIGPFPQVESLNAQNRLKVMTLLMNVYNRNISFMTKPALQALCKMCSRLSKQGFGKQTGHHRSSYGSDPMFGNSIPRPPSRIPLTSPFLLEILHGVYFSMFNGMGAVGLQALDDVHSRASHELMADVLLVTNGVRNSLHANPSGQPNDGPMGISISLSPTTSMTTVSKAIITNASFRTRKLPDDIPIQNAKEHDPNDPQKSLATISEEATNVDESGDRNSQQQHGSVASRAKEKDKEKSMAAPLMGMISKIGEKTKINKKSESGGDQPGSQGNKGKDKVTSVSFSSGGGGSVSGIAGGENRRKDGGEPPPLTGGGSSLMKTATPRRGSDSSGGTTTGVITSKSGGNVVTGMQNGDPSGGSTGSANVVIRTDSGLKSMRTTTSNHSGIAADVIETRNNSVMLKKASIENDASNETNGDAGSLTHSSTEDDDHIVSGISSFQSEHRHQGILSNSEIHTYV